MSCDDINKEFEVLTDLALKYAQGLPLAIEVLGSFLYGRDISEWRSAFNRLSDNPKKEIMDVLQISFDGLEQTDKEIFLDIACFFRNRPRIFVKRVLDYCGFHSDIGIRVLIDKSLITENDDKIRMHDKLQELGMNIVRQKAPNAPGKWSRIWHHEDYRNVMHEKMAMDNLEAIMLEPPMIEENVTFWAEALSRMNRLRLLIIRNMNFSGSLSCLSNGLRFLEWEEYPLAYFPSNCELINLVELSLPYSSIKQLWEGIKPMYKLKAMNLNFSRHLVKTPDFNGTPNLERLNLEGCAKLVHIYPSIGLLRKLSYLNLDGCTSLTSLPNSIFGLSSLEHVDLRGCSKVFHSELPENARHGISDAIIQCQSPFSFFKRLKLMWPFHLHDSARHYDIVGSQMLSLDRLYCLRMLNLSFCSLLNIPESMASLYCLEVLSLEGNNFVTLPCFIKKLPRLKSLELDHCQQLTYLSEFPLRTVFPVGEELGEVELRMFNCPKLDETEGLSSSAISWMIQFLKVHKESSAPIDIVIPGTQIPSWFNHQSVGDSITIGSFNLHDSDLIGIAFCAAFVAHYHPTCLSYEPECPMIFCEFQIGMDGFSRYVTRVRETDGVPNELVHLSLVCFTHQELIRYYTPREKANMDAGSFTFKLSSLWNPPGLHFEVKSCGVRVVFKQDLEELDNDG